MAKQRLFPEPQKPPDNDAAANEEFERLAIQVFTVPKSEIDKREKEWQRKKSKRR